MDPYTGKDEARRLIDRLGGEWKTVMELLERQFTVLHHRAQVMLGLCGIVITVTGFSGRLVAQTGAAARWLILVGIALVLAAAGTVVLGVLPLRWITQHPGDDLTQWTETVIAYRDRKTRRYRLAALIMIVGLALYVGAMGLMLAYPEAAPPMHSTR